MLLGHGAQVNQADNDGITPLYIACQEGHASVCEMLLSHGADINKHGNAFSPLSIASRNGHVSVSHLLLTRYPSSAIVSLLNLPNDLILLILEHFSLDELFFFQQYAFFLSPSQQQSSSSASPSQDRIRSNLLQLFNHCDGHLFHRFELTPRYLNWLRRIGIRIARIKFQDFDEESLEYLKAHKTSLKDLDFSSSSKLLNKHLNQIGSCPCLTSLSLAHCAKITDPNLLKFLKSNPQLERLNLSSTSQLTEQIIGRLGDCCQNLQQLVVSRNSWFDRNSLMLLVEPLSRLKSLDISHSPIPPPSIIDFLKAKPGILSIAYDVIPLTANLDGRHLLMKLALRSIMSSDIESQKIGFNNLHLLLQEDADTLYEMVRSTGALKHIAQCLAHPVDFSLPPPLPLLRCSDLIPKVLFCRFFLRMLSDCVTT
jgi:hypothetical protein